MEKKVRKKKVRGEEHRDRDDERDGDKKSREIESK